MHATATQIPIEMQLDAIETRGDTWGEIMIRHIDLPPGVDFTPLFEGLPGNLCQCPHWGMVTAGAITVRYADGTEETTSAGEMYHWPAGHTGWTDHGVTFVEFSPAELIQPVLDHLAARMAP